jgi:hypothetical protein
MASNCVDLPAQEVAAVRGLLHDKLGYVLPVGILVAPRTK